MEVILLQDVKNLGSKNEIVKVKNGYANNFLIPQGMATMATTPARKVLAENLKQQAFKEDKLKNLALVTMEKIKNKEIKIGAKTSSTGKIFGSVNTIIIAEAIAKKGVEIDRKCIQIDEDHIKEVGKYVAKIKLHREVEFDLPFEVFSE